MPKDRTKNSKASTGRAVPGSSSASGGSRPALCPPSNPLPGEAPHLMPSDQPEADAMARAWRYAVRTLKMRMEALLVANACHCGTLYLADALAICDQEFARCLGTVAPPSATPPLRRTRPADRGVDCHG